MKISSPTRLPSQRYTSQTGERWLIEISTDGVELDLAGAVLDGEDFRGYGVYVHDCEGVVIRNGLIKGFHYGIRAERVKNLTVSGCVVTENYNAPGIGWLADTARPETEGFGGGLYIRDGVGCVVENNELGANFDGLDLVHCTDSTVRANSASGCGNVGIHLLDSNRNTIEGNRANRCIRYAGRFWNDTADSSGILLEEYSHENGIVGNTMRYSGDGLFSAPTTGTPPTATTSPKTTAAYRPTTPSRLYSQRAISSKTILLTIQTTASGSATPATRSYGTTVCVRTGWTE